MCRVVPFMQNLTILANSFTLVMIAFDRYMALNKLIKSKWEFGVTACVILFAFIWAIAGGISSSALWNYKNYRVEIYIPPHDPTILPEFYNAHMCIADKEINGRYYVLVFSFVFVPTTNVFIWLNTIIATEIWDRRRAVKKVAPINSTQSSEACSSDPNADATPNYRTLTTTITNTNGMTFILPCM